MGDAPDGRLVNASGFALGEAYTCALSHAERHQHGRHYTPRILAEALWREVERAGIELPAGPVVDPASGAGALLLRPLRQYVGACGTCDPVEALRRAGEGFTGVDNDPLAAWLGNAILAAELLSLWARVPERERAPLPRLITWGDGLEPQPDSAAVVLMNPPYGRAALDAEDRLRWARSLYGHANWYGVFLHAAVERVAPGGVVAAVLPASFLGGAYYQRLRGFLAERAPLVRLRLIDDRSGVFSGVLQETCLAVFHKGARSTGVACSTQVVNGRVRSVDLGRQALPMVDPELPWLLPRAQTDVGLIKAAGRTARRLGDYGWKASTGPLVWNRHKRQISARRREGAVPILWAADIAPGVVRRSPARAAQRWLTPRERDGFMVLTEPAVLVQRTTAPEQPRRLVAAALTAQALHNDWGDAVIVENHVNVLRPIDGRDGPLSAELLVALLNTPTLDRLYRCLTGTVAVSAYELEALPLPEEQTLVALGGLAGEEVTAALAEAFA